jgi:hypothetical protein
VAYHPSLLPYIPNCLCSILRVGSALVVEASISLSIIGGYTGSIARGALGTLESLLIGLSEEERQTRQNRRITRYFKR